MKIPSIAEIDARQSMKKLMSGASTAEAVLDCIRSEEDGRALLASRTLIDADLAVPLRNEILDILQKRFAGSRMQYAFGYLKYGLSHRESLSSAIEAPLHRAGTLRVLADLERAIWGIKRYGFAPDGKRYSDGVLGSMRGFLTEAIPFVIGHCARRGVLPDGIGPRISAGEMAELLERLSRWVSINGILIEVCYGHYEPIGRGGALPPEVARVLDPLPAGAWRFFLNLQPSYWRRLEAYRDLNIGWERHVGAVRRTGGSLLESAHITRRITTDGPVYIDASRADEIVEALESAHDLETLEMVYGPPETEFRYAGRSVNIGQLLRVCWRIQQHARFISRQQAKRRAASATNLVTRYGRRALQRTLVLDDAEEVLLQLLSCDVATSVGSKLATALLLRHGDHFLLLPTLALGATLHKVVDKVLSRRDVAVQLPRHKGKGDRFEEIIARELGRSGLSVGRIAGDGGRVPEVDAIVLVGSSYALVCEAKCAVMPEERHEAFGFLENHMSKALMQAAERVAFIRREPTKASSLSGLDLAGRKVIPVIVTNHPYFSGLRAEGPEGEGIAVMDLGLLRSIVVDRKAPRWRLARGGDTYHREEVYLKTEDEVVAAVQDPLRFLHGLRKPTIQIQPNGSAFEIHQDVEWE